jgi:ATP-dependent Clp protease ATP-binding subunit ClpA
MKEHSEGSVDLVDLAKWPDSGRADHMRSDTTEKFTTELMTGGMGFVRPSETITYRVDEKLGCKAVEAARQKFSPEFINRLDNLVVFRPLRREQLREVLYIELRKVQS